jgi:hypothetical protein
MNSSTQNKVMATALCCMLAVQLATATGCSAGQSPNVAISTPAPEQTNDPRLLALKADNYKQKSIASFDAAFAPVADLALQQNDDDDFMSTLCYARRELQAEENPYLVLGAGAAAIPPNGNEANLSITYELHWQITDKENTTVAQRDEVLNTAQMGVQEILNTRVENQLAQEANETSLQGDLDALADALSTETIHLTITQKQ